VRRLDPRSAGLDELYAGLTLPRGEDRQDGDEDRPWVAIGMVSTIDGGATVAGRTLELGGDADRIAFRALRGACDAILVGAGTVRAESYGPPGGPAARQQDRVARGLEARPRLVVVTGSLSLDADHRMFSDPAQRPLLVTHASADVRREAALADVADVLRCGERTVDLREALRALRALGYGRILCEGGPSLNAALLAEGLVDEVFLTIAPVLAAGAAPRIVAGGEELALGFALVDLHEHDSELVLRYRRSS
jgi:riboflavin-specific deaminase-like protein